MSRAAWNISPRAANVTYGKRENFEWEKKINKREREREEEEEEDSNVKLHMDTNGQMGAFSNIYTWSFNSWSIT